MQRPWPLKAHWGFRCTDIEKAQLRELKVVVSLEAEEFFGVRDELGPQVSEEGWFGIFRRAMRQRDTFVFQQQVPLVPQAREQVHLC